MEDLNEPGEVSLELREDSRHHLGIINLQVVNEATERSKGPTRALRFLGHQDNEKVLKEAAKEKNRDYKITTVRRCNNLNRTKWPTV